MVVVALLVHFKKYLHVSFFLYFFTASLIVIVIILLLWLNVGLGQAKLWTSLTQKEIDLIIKLIHNQHLTIIHITTIFIHIIEMSVIHFFQPIFNLSLCFEFHHTTIMAELLFASTKKVAPSDSPTLVTSTVVRTIYPPLPASDSGRWGFSTSIGLVKPVLRKELLLL